MAGRFLPAIAMILAIAPPVLGDTYKWVDAKGVVNYSNAPPPGQAAQKQVVEERISVIPPDPSIGAAVAAMNARAARRAAYDEADYAMRQRYMLAAQAGYGADYCAYGADCGMGYAPAYYYPYAYGGAVFYARALRPHPPVVTHYRAAFHGGGRGAMHGGRGSFR
ncbi:MAG TPA: DUF4124 domain-containing protein [Burkholderiales bacterium]|nr:DUF4124 domain-containing protein [Burkholderiales bacterium]